MMKSAGMSQDLEDERIIQIEDIIYDQPALGINREPASSQLRNYQNSRISQGSMSPRKINYGSTPTYAARSERTDQIGAR